MKLNKKKLLLNVLSLASLIAVVSSCGNRKPDGPDGDDDKDVALDKPNQTITLSSEFTKTAEDSTYFSAQLVREGGENPTYVTSKQTALLKAGESVHLYAFDIPKGFTTGVTVLDAARELSKDLVVSSDGTVTAPSVTQKTEFTLILFGVSADEKQVIKQDIDVTVVPTESFVSDGYLDLTGVTGEEKTKMAASVERYLYNKGLAPITYMNDESYSLYSERLSTPFLDSGNYIPGYGYGLLDYGSVTAPLAGEKTDKYKNYLHDQVDATYDEGNFNYLNSNSNSVSTFYSYVSQYYFSNLVNETSDGWEYQAQLSRKKAPEAVNPDANGASDTWKIYLRVGTNADDAVGGTKGLTYRTASQTFKAFDKRNIKLEDYLTTFKLLATQSVGWYRGAEQAGESTQNRQVKGFAEFYNDTKDATSLPSDEEFMKKVGVKIDPSDNSISITFNGKITPDYAEYQLNGLWCNPMCEEFVKQLGEGNVIKGAQAYGTSATIGGKSLTPLDTLLSVGPYYTATYESKKTIAFAKNEDWPIKKDDSGRDLFKLEGIHLNVNSALSTDPKELLNKFTRNETDTSNIPETEWDKYATDPRRKKNGAEQNYCYFVNTWDKAFYDQQFGGNWEVKPMLSNTNFFKGLEVGINRKDISEAFHKGPGFEIQEPVNKISPKSDKAYNDTDEHKAVMKEVFGNVFDDDQLANWKTNAAEYFQAAIKEELDAGHYKLGKKGAPTVVSMKLARLQGAETANKRLSMVAESWQDAFDLAVKSFVDKDGKTPWVAEDGSALITFKVEYEDIANSSNQQMQADILNNGVKAGRFDGQTVYFVSGNGLDSLNNFDKFKSNDSSGFTLNFGADTSIPSADVEYDGKYYSFDSLWGAANTTAFVDENGIQVSEFSANDLYVEPTYKDGKYTVELEISYLEKYISDIKVYVDTISATGVEAYKPLDAKVVDGKITLTFEGDAIIDGKWLGKDYVGANYLDFQFTYKKTVNGVESEGTYGGYWLLEKPSAN